MALTERVRAWAAEGSTETFRERRIHVHRRAGEGPALLLLHGFPSSSYDYRALLDALPGRAALTFDFLGFGLSDKPAGHQYTLGWQADLAEELVARAGNPEVAVVAHDMGTSVATELFARELRGEGRIEITGALLFNGSMLQDRATPTPGQKLLRSRLGPVFARLTSERSFRWQFARIFSAGHPLSNDEAADQWALLSHNGGHRLGHRLIEYMEERYRHVERWHGAIRDWPGALSLAWGLEDPVANIGVLDGLRELRPGVPVTEWRDLGHYPQLEDPARVATVVAETL